MNATHEHAYDRRWWTLGVLCLSLLIVFVGNASLSVAIPTLSRALGASNSELQWVIAVYSLVFAGLLFPSGALGDRFGRKSALQWGLGLYLVACLLATASHAVWQLIGCRALMGAGAAFIMPSTLSILVNVFHAEERTKAIAIWASFTGAAGVIGPLASGWLLGHFWYGSVFLINVPILVLALVSGWLLVPRSRDPAQGRLDPIGSVLSVVGIVALVYGLIQAPRVGWGSAEMLTAFAIGIAVLSAFVAWESRVAEPMLDIRLFRVPAFSAGTGGMILLFLAIYGVMFLVHQYFQLILGYSPVRAALAYLPVMPILIIISTLTPGLSVRFGANRTVAFGMTAVAVGLLLLLALDQHTPYWYLLVFFVLFVGGLALSMSPMTSAIMSVVPRDGAGVGSAMNDATRELGATLRVAVMGSVAATRYTSRLHDVTESLPLSSRKAARSSLTEALEVASKLPRGAGKTLTFGAQNAFIEGIHLAVFLGAMLAAVSAVMVARHLPRQHAIGSAHTPVERTEGGAELGLAGMPQMLRDDDHGDAAAAQDGKVMWCPTPNKQKGTTRSAVCDAIF